MTYKKFLERLAELDHYWILKDGGMIRNECGDCPWTSFRGSIDIVRNGIEISSQIFTAADNDKYCNSAIRADLLRACKLIERGETP